MCVRQRTFVFTVWKNVSNFPECNFFSRTHKLFCKQKSFIHLKWRQHNKSDGEANVNCTKPQNVLSTMATCTHRYSYTLSLLCLHLFQHFHHILVRKSLEAKWKTLLFDVFSSSTFAVIVIMCVWKHFWFMLFAPQFFCKLIFLLSSFY